MVQIEMSWDEIKRRAKNGASLTVLAELNGVTNETMRKTIAKLEKETGEKCVFSKPEKQVKAKKTPLDKNKVIELHKQGLKNAEIARRMGTYDARISIIIKAWKQKENLMTPPPIVPIDQKTEDILAPLDKTVEDFFGPEPEPKRRFDPGVIDCIDANIDGLKDELQKLEDQMEMLKKQLADWEYLLAITEGGKT